MGSHEGRLEMDTPPAGPRFFWGIMIHGNSDKAYGEQVTSGKSDSYRDSVYKLISFSGIYGITDREIMAKLKETDPNNVRPEITRLKDDGLIREIGKTKCRFTGKTVRLVVVTELPYFPRNARTPIRTDLFHVKPTGGMC